jgi:hypothetical protein
MVQAFDFKSSDTIHKMMETLIDQEKEKKRQDDLKPRMQTALGAHLAKIIQSKNSEQWYPGAREAVRSPQEYMAQCENLLSKLDDKGWKRSYHQVFAVRT